MACDGWWDRPSGSSERSGLGIPESIHDADRLRPLHDRASRPLARGDPRLRPRASASTASSSSNPPPIDPTSTRPGWPRSGAGPTRWGCTLEVGLPSPNPAAAVPRTRAGRSSPPSTPATCPARRGRRRAGLPPRPRLSSATATTGSGPTSPGPTSWTRSSTSCSVWRPAFATWASAVAIETHADLTVDEILGLLDRLGPEVAGVTLDTGNLVMRLDDPVARRRAAGPARPGHPRQGRGARLHPARALLAGPAGRLGDLADARPARPPPPGQPRA